MHLLSVIKLVLYSPPRPPLLPGQRGVAAKFIWVVTLRQDVRQHVATRRATQRVTSRHSVIRRDATKRGTTRDKRGTTRHDAAQHVATRRATQRVTSQSDATRQTYDDATPTRQGATRHVMISSGHVADITTLSLAGEWVGATGTSDLPQATADNSSFTPPCTGCNGLVYIAQ